MKARVLHGPHGSWQVSSPTVQTGRDSRCAEQATQRELGSPCTLRDGGCLGGVGAHRIRSILLQHQHDRAQQKRLPCHPCRDPLQESTGTDRCCGYVIVGTQTNAMQDPFVKTTCSACPLDCLVRSGIGPASRNIMADHAEQISTFEAVTGTPELTVCQPQGGRPMPSATHREHLCPSWPAGADSETAQRCLSAMRWDLDRAVNFFMENGADGMGMLPRPAITPEVVELSDGDSPAAPREPPASAVDDEDDPELQEALAASRRAGAWVPPSEAMIPVQSKCQ